MFSKKTPHCPACLSVAFGSDRIRSSDRPMSVPGLEHSRCLECNTVYLNPLPTEKELSEFYACNQTEEAVQEIAISSAKRVLEPDRRKYFFDNRVQPLLDYIPSNATIFDIGCGVGAFVHAMTEAGFDAKGCDLSSRSIAAGLEILKLHGRIFIGDNYALPSQQFDCLTLWTVIEHLLNPEDYLKYLRTNRLSASGFLLVEFPTTDSLMFEYLGEHFKWIMPPYHINLFSQKGMRTMLDRCGYDVIHTHQMPRNWYFMESVASKLRISGEHMNYLSAKIPELGIEIDRIFDDIAVHMGKSSTIWMLARAR